MTRATGLDAELLESKKKMVTGRYLRNAWYVAAWSDDLADGQLLGRTILKEPIVLYRKSDGHVAALQDRCPHRFAPLHMGKIVKGDFVQCPYHGLEFNSSGACVLNPHGTKNIPPRARVRSYPVTEKHIAPIGELRHEPTLSTSIARKRLPSRPPGTTYGDTG